MLHLSENKMTEEMRRCAKDCRQFAGDAQMAACADVCLRCAESCQHMAHMA